VKPSSAKFVDEEQREKKEKTFDKSPLARPPSPIQIKTGNEVYLRARIGEIEID